MSKEIDYSALALEDTIYPGGMTVGEMITAYRQAKNKGEQVQTLADLSSCSKDVIIEILLSHGFKPSEMPRTRARKDENPPQRAEADTKKNGNPPKGWEVYRPKNEKPSGDLDAALKRVVAAVTALREKEKELAPALNALVAAGEAFADATRAYRAQFPVKGAKK